MRRWAMVLAAGLLSACGGDETLQGQGYLPPSEVTAMRTIPLTVPPDYGVRPAGVSSNIVDEREDTVVQTLPLDMTVGEQVLLTRAGALDADPTIRQTLSRENALLTDDPALVEALLFGSYPSGEEVTPDVVIVQPEDESDWFDEAWDSLGE